MSKPRVECSWSEPKQKKKRKKNSSVPSCITIKVFLERTKSRMWITLRGQQACGWWLRFVLVAIFCRETTICRSCQRSVFFLVCFIFVVAALILTGLNARRQDVIDGKLHFLIQIEPVRPEQKFPNDNEVARNSSSINKLIEEKGTTTTTKACIIQFYRRLHISILFHLWTQSSCIICSHIGNRPRSWRTCRDVGSKFFQLICMYSVLSDHFIIIFRLCLMYVEPGCAPLTPATRRDREGGRECLTRARSQPLTR